MKNVKAFIDIAESSSVISGEFNFKVDNDELMDRDFVDKEFRGCKLFYGDFCSSGFHNCTFNKVIFRESALVGVSFDNCTFIGCRFSNVDCDFSMKNCKVEGLIVTKESEEVLSKHRQHY